MPPNKSLDRTPSVTQVLGTPYEIGVLLSRHDTYSPGDQGSTRSEVPFPSHAQPGQGSSRLRIFLVLRDYGFFCRAYEPWLGQRQALNEAILSPQPGLERALGFCSRG